MGCFCANCRHLRVVDYSRRSTEELHKLFHTSLPDEENVHLYKYHQIVLDIIAAGKTFKEVALLNTGYKYFKSWAKNHQEPYKHWTDQQLDKFCNKVNEVVGVYDKWDQIVRNLTDSRMDQIDARRFSVHYFALAKKLEWCLIYNEQMRRRKEKSDKRLYSEDTYQDIKQYILASGVLEGMDRPNDPHIAAMMMRRLSSEIVTICNNRPHPPPSP